MLQIENPLNLGVKAFPTTFFSHEIKIVSNFFAGKDKNSSDQLALEVPGCVCGIKFHINSEIKCQDWRKITYLS